MKGTITASLGDARYQVILATDSTLLTSERARAQAAYDAASVEVATLTSTVDTLEGAHRSALWAVYSASDAYQEDLLTLTADAALEAEESACADARDRAYSVCADRSDDLGSLMVCRARADTAYQHGLAAAPERARAALDAHREAAHDRHQADITAAQTAAAGVVASLQAARERLRAAQARALSAGLRLDQLAAIADRETSITLYSAQCETDLEPDDEVTIARTPAGRHVITSMVSAGKTMLDARVLPALPLMLDAALITGAETWLPAWRTGEVMERNDDGTLRVWVDPGTLSGSLGTAHSRRTIDCTPPQAYFDGDWADVEAAIAAAQDALEAAQGAAAAARAALAEAIAGAAADRDACVSSGDQGCLTSWGGWLEDCRAVNPPAQCQEQYDDQLALCMAGVREDCDAAYQAAVADLHTQHDPLIAAADEVVVAAIEALTLARGRILGPADPLILDLPIAHCHASVYQVGDSVLIDFPVRAVTRADPLAVWRSGRVIGWADAPRPCGIRMELGLMVMSGLVADVPMPFVLTLPTWLSAWAGGAGVTIPGSSPARSSTMLGEQRPAAGLVPAVDYPADAQWQGQVYATRAALDAVCADGVTRLQFPAHEYRGGAMLLAEGCVSRGRLLTAALPDGIQSGYGRLGVGWSPGGDIYAFDVSSSGLVARRLKVPDLVTINHGWWVAGDLSGDAGHINRLRLFGALEPDPAAPLLTLLSAAQLAACYADGAAPLWGGWQWTWQGSLSASLSAHWTGCWGPLADGRRRARSCRIDIAWTGGVPAATVTVDAAQTWGGGILRVPAGMGLPLPVSLEGSADAVVYTWTTPSGPCRLVRVGPRTGGTETHSAAWPSPILATASYADTAYTRTRLAGSGWRIEGAASTDADLGGGLSAADLTDYATAPTGQTTYTRGADGCSLFVGCVAWLGDHWGSAPSGGRYVPKTLVMHSRHSRVISSSRHGGTWGACAAIADGGGVVIGAAQSWAGYVERTQTADYSDLVTSASWPAGPYGPAGDVQAGLRAGDQGTFCFLSNCDGSGNGITAWGGYWGPSGIVTVDRAVPGGDQYRHLRLVGVDGQVRDLPAADWLALWSPTGETALPSERTSVRGSSLWTTGPTVWTSDCGISATDAAHGAGWAGG